MRSRDRASSDLYDSGGRRITRTPQEDRRRAPTIATQGMLAILQPQGYPYRLSCLLCNKIMPDNNNNNSLYRSYRQVLRGLLVTEQAAAEN